MWMAVEIISTILWWMGMQFTLPFSILATFIILSKLEMFIQIA